MFNPLNSHKPLNLSPTLITKRMKAPCKPTQGVSVPVPVATSSAKLIGANFDGINPVVVLKQKTGNRWPAKAR